MIEKAVETATSTKRIVYLPRNLGQTSTRECPRETLAPRHAATLSSVGRSRSPRYPRFLVDCIIVGRQQHATTIGHESCEEIEHRCGRGGIET